MSLENRVKEKISIEVIKTLVTRFDSFPEDASHNRNAPFHEAFLEAFADKKAYNPVIHLRPTGIRSLYSFHPAC